MSSIDFSDTQSITTMPIDDKTIKMSDTLLLDCRNGVRKGALVESLLGLLDETLSSEFVSEFNKIGLEETQAAFSKEKVDGSACTKFEILDNGNVEKFSSVHSDGQSHNSRSLSDVSYIIDTLEIDGKVANDAIGVYEILAQAEATAHETFPGSVHFHEVGNDFAIGSIVAFCMLMNRIKPKHIIATPITTGFGFVDCAHGHIAIPTPATANILEGLPTNVGNVEGELTTPTGAAMVSYFTKKFTNEKNIASFFDANHKYAIGNGIDNKKLGPIRSIVQIAE